MAGSSRLDLVAFISVLGMGFSGYLTYLTYATGQGGCEVFYFGYPSCFYGMLMYLLAFLLGASLLASGRDLRLVAIVVISGFGIVFSGSLTWYVLSQLSCTTLSIAGVPPCIFGFVIYALVLAFAASLARAGPRRGKPPASTPI